MVTNTTATTETELVETGEGRDRLGRRITPAARRTELVKAWQASGYLRLRAKVPAYTDQMFISHDGRPLSNDMAYHNFRVVSQGLYPRGSRPRPRFHDLRHTFASHWFAEWSRHGAPVAHHLLLLCRNLGHRHF